MIKEVLRFKVDQEDDMFVSENEQTIICGEHLVYALSIEQHYSMALTRFLSQKYSTLKSEDSFRAYQRMLALKMQDTSYLQTNITENICMFDSTEQQNLKMAKSQLITGIADMFQVYVKYALNSKKRQVLFSFKIINMTPFLIENINIDIERNLSFISKPYPETSKSFFIKSLSTRQVHEWNSLFILNSYSENMTCRLRIQMPPNQDCQFEEDIVLYSRSFGVKFLDLMIPDILQSYRFSQVKFH